MEPMQIVKVELMWRGSSQVENKHVGKDEKQ